MSNVSSSNSQEANVPKLRFPGFEGEWSEHTLGELGNFIKGAPLSKADISDEGTPFILYGELYTTYNEVIDFVVRKTNRQVSPEHISKIGDVIIPTSGETPEEIATASCVMQSGVILAGDLNIYRTSLVDGRLISYIIRHVVNRHISSVAQGKSVVHVKADELAKIYIRYPEKNEQLKILNFLALIQKRIDHQKKFIDTLKSYKRGALSRLFPKNGASVPEYRFSGFTDDWEQRKLGEITSLITKGTTPLDKSGSGNINFIKIENIDLESGAIIPETKISVEEHNGYLKRSQLQENDILFSIAGTLGRIGIVKSSILPANTNQALAIIRVKDGDLKYLATVLRGNEVSDFIKKNPTVGAQPNLSLEQIANLKIAYPSLEEQVKIGCYFDTLDTLITLHQKKVEQYINLKQSMLEKLFI